MPTIAEMRARLKANEKKFDRDNSIYPFWKLDFDKSSTLRLIPWIDPVTGMTWTEKKVLPMTFVDPQDESKQITFKAPCLEMYDTGAKCPVKAVVSALYGEADEFKKAGRSTEEDALRKIAGKHWIDVTFYHQGFVNKSGFAEEDTPENPIRRFPFTKKIQTKLVSTIFDENDPFDILPTGQFEMNDIKTLMDEGDKLSDSDVAEIMAKFEGYDLILKKTAQGQYADYSNSSFAKNKSSLTDEQMEAVYKYGFHDLRKALPDQPTSEQYDVLVEMMETSVAFARGEGDGLWNVEWEEVGFKPFRPKAGNKAEGGDEVETTQTRKAVSSGQASAATSTASSIAARLNKARGVSKPTEAATTEAATSAPTAATQEPEATPAASGGDKVSSLAAKIRARARENRA